MGHSAGLSPRSALAPEGLELRAQALDHLTLGVELGLKVDELRGLIADRGVLLGDPLVQFDSAGRLFLERLDDQRHQAVVVHTQPDPGLLFPPHGIRDDLSQFLSDESHLSSVCGNAIGPKSLDPAIADASHLHQGIEGGIYGRDVPFQPLIGVGTNPVWNSPVLVDGLVTPLG